VEGAPEDGLAMDQSGAPAFGKDKAMNYNMSKAGNLFYGVEGAKRYGGDGILSVVCTVPHWIPTATDLSSRSIQEI
jgi:hypothetical protein